ncbi:hypothetical protein ACFLTL_02275 [Chloroflexota bacterium]
MLVRRDKGRKSNFAPNIEGVIVPAAGRDVIGSFKALNQEDSAAGVILNLFGGAAAEFANSAAKLNAGSKLAKCRGMPQPN